jgi:hypothetical protein
MDGFSGVGVGGEGCWILGGRDPNYLLITNVLYFITSVGNHHFPYHLTAIWVYPTGMVVFHEPNLTNSAWNPTDQLGKQETQWPEMETFLWSKKVLGGNICCVSSRSGFSDPDERPESRAFQEVKNEAKRPIRSFPSLSLAFSHTLIKRPILKHRNMKL